jgi:Flp pilus assembly protein CpaB
MSPVVPRRPGASPTFSVPMIALVTLAALVIVFGTLLAFGVVDLSRLGSKEPSTAGLIAVPTPATTIPAYTRVQRDHLWDRSRNRLAVIYLPPKSVTPEMLTSISQVIGRVLDHDKAPGYVFTQSDFLPPGTREGIVGGIPAGKRAVRISADKVDGLFGLRAGDRFDVLATLPIDANRSGGQALGVGGPYGQELALEAQLSNWNKQATVRVIVQNATIVEPMKTRGVPIYQTTLTEGSALRTRPVQEVVIAVDPDEVAPLTEAMAVDATLTTIPRSGRPDDPPNSRTPDLRPFSPFTTPGAATDPAVRGNRDSAGFAMVETIMGQRRSLSAVPRR